MREKRLEKEETGEKNGSNGVGYGVRGVRD